MNTVDELWETLFDREMTASERRVMENIARCSNGDESTLIASAVTVHCLYSTLIMDPDSPVRLTAKVGKVLAELEAHTARMTRLVDKATSITGCLKDDALETHKALAAAEDFARWQRNNRVTVFERNKAPDASEYSVSLDIVRIFCAACVASSIFGGLIAFGIGLMVIGGH
ncbi:hypothetical protein [Aurantiacibacter zhengii]|uniref:Uncharacterized protein n=1 Tax=Aurantiacibacter zhengii TaxID=2307003 RepID=A0A418NR66_9SPHN|nr:hypothetical protein [Aurantiacibacter zhengii]RIV85188.1 hypothetical protein D2V07_12985 [Aurantiacibacter zhengii]